MAPLRVGVLGLRRGMTFARQFDALPDAQTVAVCDRNPAQQQAGESTFAGRAQVFDNYADMLAADLDAVVVASPAPDHAEHCCMALHAGKHVLSEVPADVTMEACERLVRTVRKTGLKYMLAENCCYWGYIREYQRQVQSGRLGEVLYAECEYLHDVRTLFYEHTSLPPGAAVDEVLKHGETTLTWRHNLHPISYLTHDLGPVLEILDDRCVSVSCLSTRPAVGEGFAPAAEVAIFKTAGGRVIKFLAEFSMPRPGHHWFVLMGTKGSIESPRGTGSKHLVWAEGENMEGWSEMSWSTKMMEGPKEAMASGHGGADWHISREFTDCILNDTRSPIDVYRAMDYTVPGVCAVQSTEQGGTAVDVPDLREL